MWTSYWNPAVVALLLVVVALSTSAGDGLDEAYQRAIEHLANGRFSDAATCFDEVISRNPSNKEAYRWRGFAHLLRGDPQSAIADFTDGILLDPADAVLFYGRGSAYKLLGENDEALFDFSKAIRLDEEYGAAYSARADINVDSASRHADLSRAMQLGLPLAKRSAGRRQPPAAPYAQLITASRINVEVFLEYRCWQFIRKEYSVSLAAASEPTPERPGNAEAYKKLALRYASRRELDKCICALDEAVKLAPKDQNAYRLRGVVHVIRRDLTAAFADLTRAVELNPMDYECYAFRASVCLELGKFQNALHDMKKVGDIMEQYVKQAAEKARIPAPQIDD